MQRVAAARHDGGAIHRLQDAAHRQVVRWRAHASSEAVGGHSYGGRVASLLAPDVPVAGPLLLSYPLHAPGRQESWDERTEHWTRAPLVR